QQLASGARAKFFSILDHMHAVRTFWGWIGCDSAGFGRCCARYEVSLKNSSATCGQASSAQSAKLRSLRNTSDLFAMGSTHRKLPDWPKCPKVSGEFKEPVQCGVLSAFISKPSPQALSLWRP